MNKWSTVSLQLDLYYLHYKGGKILMNGQIIELLKTEKKNNTENGSQHLNTPICSLLNESRYRYNLSFTVEPFILSKNFIFPKGCN